MYFYIQRKQHKTAIQQLLALKQCKKHIDLNTNKGFFTVLFLLLCKQSDISNVYILKVGISNYIKTIWAATCL